MATKIMKAVQYEGYGGGAAGLKHTEIPIPSPKKDEVLLKVEATSVNPIDWKVQKGMLRPFLPPRFPFVPGVDVTGEVTEAGPQVANFKKGDKVIAMLSLPNSGGLAEFAVAPTNMTVSRPVELSPAEGAGLPTAALIALQALKTAGTTKFDGTGKSSNILITAASGGVGHYAVQLAKRAGLHVTATCGDRNVEFVKQLGADEVLDYKTPQGACLTSPSGKKYDAVIHCTSGIPWSTFEPNLSAYGTVIDISPSFKSMVAALYKKVTLSKKKLVTLVLAPKVEDMRFVVELAKEGRLRTCVDSIHGLSTAEAAWAKSISGHATGKIIVEM
ncbi:hypothetical protein OPV22_009963 [Ensete ventricosum]|uniref:Enoyl reductase (ER) domain-containing protein n=2 Tax=Ensete ventricosum TaxID=4639 RepID=A0AAV8RA29_ENSVE|nr:hypothetical protein OPV22_009963 [Ensete ventricosum]